MSLEISEDFIIGIENSDYWEFSLFFASLKFI